MAKSLTEMAAEIVAALATHKVLSSEEIDTTLKSIFQALLKIREMEDALSQHGSPGVSKQRLTSKPSNASIDPLSSIRKDRVICLECHQQFRHLTHTHLKHHGLTPKTYRKKYGIPDKQPLMADTVRMKKHIQATKLAERIRKARKSTKTD